MVADLGDARLRGDGLLSWTRRYPPHVSGGVHTPHTAVLQNGTKKQLLVWSGMGAAKKLQTS